MNWNLSVPFQETASALHEASRKALLDGTKHGRCRVYQISLRSVRNSDLERRRRCTDALCLKFERSVHLPTHTAPPRWEARPAREPIRARAGAIDMAVTEYRARRLSSRVYIPSSAMPSFFSPPLFCRSLSPSAKPERCLVARVQNTPWKTLRRGYMRRS